VRWLVVLVAVVALAAPIEAQADDTLGVTLVSQVNLEPDQVGKLLGQVAAAARPSVSDVVVDRRSVVSQGGIGLACLSEPTCLSQQAGDIGADRLLLVSFVKVGGSVQVELALVDGASGRIEMRSKAQVSLEYSGGPDLRNAVAMLLAGDRNQKAPTAQATTGPQPRDQGLPTGFWVASGTGAALLLGGTIAAILTASKNGEIEDCGPVEPGGFARCPEPVVDELKSSRDSRALAADILIGTSLVAGGAALVILLTQDDGEKAPTTVIGPGPGIGLGLTSRF
jgi:hypothetical protein